MVVVVIESYTQPRTLIGRGAGYDTTLQKGVQGKDDNTGCAPILLTSLRDTSSEYKPSSDEK